MSNFFENGFNKIQITNFLLFHLIISAIINILNFLRFFIDILHKYKFHDERVFSVN